VDGVQRWGRTYFAERVLFGCFIFANNRVEVVPVVTAGPTVFLRARSLAVRVVGTAEMGRLELRIWRDISNIS